MPRVAKKTAASKKAAPQRSNIRVLETKRVPPMTLATYAKNPRKGNVKLVAESLMENGQYRAIVVRVSKDGVKLKNPEILAGNHTWKAAIFLDAVARGEQPKPHWLEEMEARWGPVQPWPEILVDFIDANDDDAKKIVLVDNRAADAGGYDADIMKELIGSLDSHWGTGFTEEEYSMITRVSEESAKEVLTAVSNLDKYEVDDEVVDMSAGILGGAVEDEPVDDVQPLHDEPMELQNSVHDLKSDPEFKGVTQFDIPPLRADMLIEDLPEMVTWAGSATRDWPDEDVVWFYNYGIDSTSGMRVKPGNLVLSFYAWDDYFATWWDHCKERVAQALNSKVHMAVTPNFSQGEMPMAISIYNLYRSRYIGRYMQESGIRVMPDLECRNDPLIYELIKATLPKELPWGSIQVQNIAAKTKRQDIDLKERLKDWEQETITMFNTVRPANLLVYANENGFEMLDALNSKHKWGMKLRYQPTRLIALGEKAKLKKKKEGIV